MTSRKFLGLVAVLAMLGGTSAFAKTHSALSLSFEAAKDQRRWVPKDHFHVVLTNQSESRQKIWESWNSWGYYNLSFEITDSSGAKRVAKKRDIVFTRNFPSYLTIEAGGTYVLDVYFSDEGAWEGFPVRLREDETVEIRAIFDVPGTKEAAADSIWIGHIESDTIRVTFTTGGK